VDETVIVDCKTGTQVRRALSEDEKLQRQADHAETERVANDQDTENRVREAVLTKLAGAAGVTVDEVKRALGVGRSGEGPDPDKLRKRPKPKP